MAGWSLHVTINEEGKLLHQTQRDEAHINLVRGEGWGRVCHLKNKKVI